MPDSPNAAEKLCVVCGQSCAGQPRQKDAQGRYAHTACLAAAAPKAGPQDPKASSPVAPAKPAPRPRAAPVNDADIVLAGLTDQRAMHPCPGCGVLHPPEQVVCVKCGFNTATGRTVRTHISTEKVKASKERASISMPDMGSGLAALVGAIVGGGLLALWGYLAAGNYSLLIGLWAVIAAIGFVSYIGSIVAAVRDRSVPWTWFNIVGAFCLSGIPNLIYIWFFSGRPWLRLCSALSFFGAFVVLFTVGSLQEAAQSKGYENFAAMVEDDNRPLASYSARRLAREGEEPRDLDLLLNSIAVVVISENTTSDADVRKRARIVRDATSLDDYPEEVYQKVVERLARLTDAERAAMIRWAVTQGKSFDEQYQLEEDPELGPLIQSGGAKLNTP